MISRRRAPDVLYEGRDVSMLVARSGLGLVLIAVGWYQASDRLLLADQAPWLAVAVAGTVVSGVAVALWVLELRSAVSLRVASLKVDAGDVVVLEAAGETATGTEQPGAELVVVTARGARLFHATGCELVLGRDVVTADLTEHLGEGRVPCSVCSDPRAMPGEVDGLEETDV